MGEVMLWPWPAAPSPRRPAHPARLHPLRNKTPGVLNKSERKALWGLMTVAESEFKCKERKKKKPCGEGRMLSGQRGIPAVPSPSHFRGGRHCCWWSSFPTPDGHGPRGSTAHSRCCC